LDFENDLEELENALLETDQRIKKLEAHKASVNKEIRDSKSENQEIMETLRRLHKNLDDLYEKRAFLIKERDSKSSTF
jgi:chromosome segregation ATPase